MRESATKNSTVMVEPHISWGDVMNNFWQQKPGWCSVLHELSGRKSKRNGVIFHQVRPSQPL